jgi:succinate dehydrogenase / fumarate reductase membrane anchor subunit
MEREMTGSSAVAERGAACPGRATAELGSAKRGVDAWWAERVSAIVLVPLSLWLVASLVALGGANRTAFVGWLGRPLPAFLLILVLIVAFRHAALGLQVVIEDYVHSSLKVALLIAMQCVCFAVCVAGVLATLSIAFGR